MARYSVKMMTRSFDHLPPGLRCWFSQATSCRALESRWPRARLAQSFIFWSRASLLLGRLGEEAGRRVQGVGGGLVVLAVVGVVLVHAVQLELQASGSSARRPACGPCAATSRAAPAW